MKILDLCLENLPLDKPNFGFLSLSFPTDKGNLIYGMRFFREVQTPLRRANKGSDAQKSSACRILGTQPFSTVLKPTPGSTPWWEAFENLAPSATQPDLRSICPYNSWMPSLSAISKLKLAGDLAALSGFCFRWLSCAPCWTWEKVPTAKPTGKQKSKKGSEKCPLRQSSKRQTAQKLYLEKTTTIITLNKGKGLKKIKISMTTKSDGHQ